MTAAIVPTQLFVYFYVHLLKYINSMLLITDRLSVRIKSQNFLSKQVKKKKKKIGYMDEMILHCVSSS